MYLNLFPFEPEEKLQMNCNALMDVASSRSTSYVFREKETWRNEFIIAFYYVIRRIIRPIVSTSRQLLERIIIVIIV